MKTRITATDTSRVVQLIADARVHGTDRQRLEDELADLSQRVVLTGRQEAALLRLDADTWRKEHAVTLEALVYRGLAEIDYRPRHAVGRLTANGERRAAALRLRQTPTGAVDEVRTYDLRDGVLDPATLRVTKEPS